FWRNFIFAGFWPILEYEMTRPVIERQHGERRRPKPKGRTKAHVDSKPIHAHPSSKRAQRTKPTKMRSRYFGIKQSKCRFKEGFPILSFPRRYLQDNDVKRGAIVKDLNSRRCEESARERRTRDGEGMSQAGRPSPFLGRFDLPFDRWLPRLINSSHLIQLEASIHPELDENLGPRPEGDDGRRKSSKLSRRWLRPTTSAPSKLNRLKCTNQHLNT